MLVILHYWGHLGTQINCLQAGEPKAQCLKNSPIFSGTDLFRQMRCLIQDKVTLLRAMVVVQLVEQFLPILEIHGLNADIGIILSTNCTIEKRLGKAHL